MRYSWGFALPFLCPLLVAASSSDEARVLLFPSSNKAHPNRGQKLDAETARLVLSRRLGLSQLYDIGDRSDRDIETINILGGASEGLLGLEGSTLSYTHGQGFVVVEGLNSADDAIPNLDAVSYDEFTIPTSPSAEDTMELAESFEDQLRYLDSIDDSIRPAVCASVHGLMDPFTRFGFQRNAERCKPWSFSWVTGIENAEAAHQIQDAMSLLLNKANKSEHPLIVIFTSPKSRKVSKRAMNVYGNIQPKQSKQEPEMILSDATPTVAAHISPATASAEPKANSSAPIPGILPSCFSSQEHCETSTRNCSGHGECYLKYSFSKNDDDDKTVCYACACTKPEVRTNDDGSKKTTRYGGPACQKKDIVMPFWLFTGFTVVFLFVLTWAIGLLYSMGNEELPSVIGAGVSGPVKK